MEQTLGKAKLEQLYRLLDELIDSQQPATGQRHHPAPEPRRSRAAA